MGNTKPHKPTYEVEVRSVDEVAHDTYAFTLERPPEFTYQPGQYIELKLINPPLLHNEKNERHLSLASAPHEEALVVVTRNRPSAFKTQLATLRADDRVIIKGPGGSFRLHEDTTRPAVFLAGGIGVVPFYAMLKHVVHGELQHHITLITSNRRPEDALFIHELEQITTDRTQLRVVHTMTNQSASTKDWQGHQGRISSELIAEYVPDTTTPIYYIVGPLAFVTALERMLVHAGISLDAIRTEEFTGY